MLIFKGKTALYSLVLLLVLGACDIVGGGNNDDDGGGSETVTLTTAVTPDGSGTVDPSEGEFETGQEITVQASANDGWIFDGWTGDIESADNPLVFTIEENTSLTANFRQTQSAFTDSLTVSDGTNQTRLALGMAENATEGYDDGLDVEAPPVPPEGAFYGQFAITDYNLLTDIRDVGQGTTVWTLEFAPSGSNSISLSWDIDDSNITGTLTLVDNVDNPTEEVNMLDSNGYNVGSGTNTLYIVLDTGGGQ